MARISFNGGKTAISIGARRVVAKDELNLHFGVSLEIATLHDKLRILKDYLADADRQRITDQSVQGWVTKLKHTIRIKALNARLDAICKSAATFSFLKLESYEDMVAPRRSSVADRRTDPVLEQSAVVGEKIKEDTRALVRRLTDGKHKKQDAVMVVAMAIKEASDKKIWLSVTQDVNEVDLLRTAIKSAGGASDGRESNKSLLVLALVDAIRDKRFFLVLDDVWSERSWDNLLKAPFSHGAAGSRLLITIRHDEVTQRMEAIQPFHHVDKLYPQDAWLLLKKQVASSDDMEEVEIDDTLKDIGMEIIEKCGGLPLAVKQGVSPMHLVLDCSLELLTSIALRESGPEWGKLSHVQHVKAYADQRDDERKWHMLYTREPYSFETNIGDNSSSSTGVN
uniref:NB-ARC domain-containing protein n=1 Tax=Oryza glaberrima TaxID=4538 RepID=I1PTS5_ORYGL